MSTLDLGIATDTDAFPSVDLTSEEIEYARERLGLDVLPVVLGGTALWDSVAEYDAAMRSAATSLAARDLLLGGEIHHGIASTLRTLTRPAWELALRSHNQGTLTRVCVVADESLCVEASFDEATKIYTLRKGMNPADVVVRVLGPSNALQVAVINAPTDILSAALNAGPDADTVADALTQAGVPPVEAGQLGSAIVTCTSFTEIVAVPRGVGIEKLPVRVVSVFNTAHGRIVASSSTSADGTQWSSISSGTPQRLRQAVNSLIEQLSESPGAVSR
ncbi:ESX secretion-associated protein EspG [Rhodococcus globerulus]|uniref:ESX secretion-associated protein EspG n=1 Tax=Rhodococcus globerulus TaxID=33008 RepID=A0ABU4BU38_RHOGO|nr:ESX secretion-associated protein EspG [Rhodococcus globerulus]MDV6267734.1 ESX secretion-associated protein EspG [Rhodococcus globerulus]